MIINQTVRNLDLKVVRRCGAHGVSWENEQQIESEYERRGVEEGQAGPVTG